MSLVVPFDGSDLSKTALIRAAQFETVFDQNVVVVSVIPRNNTTYARERGWIGPTESFDQTKIVDKLQSVVNAIAPNAEFHHLSVGRKSPSATIANQIRNFARKNDASIVFVGSENAGRIAVSLSVGSSVTADRSYDTMIISQAKPTKITELEAVLSTEDAIN